MSQPTGKSEGGVLAAIILLVVIVGGSIGLLAVFSEKEGEECEGSAWGCARGLLCVDEGKTSRCRRQCDDENDCEDGERCSRLIVIGSDDEYRICKD